jgi:hypothetical protein
MDFQKTDEYLRAHWPAALLMATVVIPVTLAVNSYFFPSAANGPRPADDSTHAQLLDIEKRLGELHTRINVLDRLYRVWRDDENRSTEQDLAQLYTKSREAAAVPTSAPKGKP